MKKQLLFLEILFEDLMEDAKNHVKNLEEAKKKGDFWSKNYMDKNCGKTALKRKIIFLRQELLNLERMVDNEIT